MPRGDGKTLGTRRIARKVFDDPPQTRSKNLANRILWWNDLKAESGLENNVKIDNRGNAFRKPGSQNREKWGK